MKDREAGTKTGRGRILVFVEQTDGKIPDECIRLLIKAGEISKGMELYAVLMGYGIYNLAEEISGYADVVYLVESPLMRLYQSDIHPRFFCEVIRELKPEVVLAADTMIGRDIAPRTAAELRTGLISHCVDIRMENDTLVGIVAGFGGNIMVKNVSLRRPQMATVMPTAVETYKRERSGRIIRRGAEIERTEMRAETLEIVREKKEDKIENARVVVAGGYGLISMGYKYVEKLAVILGGVPGGTRPAFEEGWITKDRMIGQSGKRISPDLYIGVGVSGAMQHVVGILNSKFIFVINRDENAPIFDFCDVGIVGKAEEILPYLLEKFSSLSR